MSDAGVWVFPSGGPTFLQISMHPQTGGLCQNSWVLLTSRKKDTNLALFEFPENSRKGPARVGGLLLVSTQ